MILEGIVDALTDLILIKSNLKSYPTNEYEAVRALGYQILAVDKGIAKFYLENNHPSITARINEHLKDVIKTCKYDDDLGNRLEALAYALTYGNSDEFGNFLVGFEAQEITRAYCQTFKPDRKTIDYIRSCYLVENYEFIKIKNNNGIYEFYLLEE